jgi:hypothetical protein
MKIYHDKRSGPNPARGLGQAADSESGSFSRYIVLVGLREIPRLPVKPAGGLLLSINKLLWKTT